MSAIFVVWPVLAAREGHRAASNGIRVAALHREAHGNHGKFAVGALVHQVHDHVGQLAFHRLLAGMVKMKLLQLVAHAVEDNIAAWIHVNANGVAGVLQLDRAGDVMKFDGLKALVQMGAANVDRRLLVSLRAGSVGGVELCPSSAVQSCPE